MSDDVDLAQRDIEQAAARGAALASASLAGGGEDDCIQCGEPIEEARRSALPSAVRCVGCQQLVEGGPRRRTQ